MANEKLICNQICHWNDPSDGCVKPNGRICQMSNAKVDASGWGQVKMANEKRLIYLDDLLKFPIRITHYDMVNGNRHFVLGIESVLEYAENLPTIDAVEVVHGRWVDDYDDPRFICEECGKWLLIVDGTATMNYCPNCGAKMDGDGNA